MPWDGQQLGCDCRAVIYPLCVLLLLFRLSSALYMCFSCFSLSSLSYLARLYSGVFSLPLLLMLHRQPPAAADCTALLSSKYYLHIQRRIADNSPSSYWFLSSLFSERSWEQEMEGERRKRRTCWISLISSCIANFMHCFLEFSLFSRKQNRMMRR